MGPVCFTFLLTTALAGVPTAPGAVLSDAELAAVEGKYADHRQLNSTSGWTANFQQEVHSPDLLQPILSQGKLDFEAPDALTLTYAAPVAGQVALIHGKFQQSVPGRDAQAASAELLQSLVRFFQAPPRVWHEQFAVTATRDGNLLTIHLAAKPHEAAAQPATIEEIIDAATLDPVSLTIGFTSQASLKFTFSGWHRNNASPKS